MSTLNSNLKIISLILLPISLLTISTSAWFYFKNSTSQSIATNSSQSSVVVPNSTQSSVSIRNQISSTISSIVPSSELVQSSSIIDQVVNSISSIGDQVNLNFRQLTGQDFQAIFESINYPKTQLTKEQSVITDNLVVDNHIRTLGEKRGYKKRPSAFDNNLVFVDGQRLQLEAKDAWDNLRNQAKNEGFNLVITSGFRSSVEQRSMFVASMAPEYPTQDLLSGKIDPDLNTIMNIVSPPGYSRHHTGYTIDIACLGESTSFKLTNCYRWASANNFAKVRQFGWIPSYPVGVNNQGPNPEEWEFVWVGDLAK